MARILFLLACAALATLAFLQFLDGAKLFPAPGRRPLHPSSRSSSPTPLSCPAPHPRCTSITQSRRALLFACLLSFFLLDGLQAPEDLLLVQYLVPCWPGKACGQSEAWGREGWELAHIPPPEAKVSGRGRGRVLGQKAPPAVGQGLAEAAVGNQQL